MGRSRDKSEAFLALLLPLQRSLEVYCRRMLNHPSEVEDILQDAVMRAFTQFDRYTEGTNFRAWMFRFVTLEIFNRNRKRELTSAGEFLIDVPAKPHEDFPEDAGDALIDPESLSEHLDDQVVQALWQLTHSERTVLHLRAIGQFTYQEIHDILSIPLGSVIGYLSRARRKMRQALADYAAERGLIRRPALPGESP